MTPETAPSRGNPRHPSAALNLEQTILNVLTTHDGLCTDNDEERQLLTKALLHVVMQWSSTPEESIDGLFRFDGGVWSFDPIRGAPHMLILFPSRHTCPMTTEVSGDRVSISVNVCGELWLPFYTTCEEGFREAVVRDTYRVKQVCDGTLEIWDHSPEFFRIKDAQPSHVLVRYDNQAGYMADVVFVKDMPGAERQEVGG